MSARLFLKRDGLINWVMLSLTYFFYFGHLGVFVPYLGIFLDGRGFSSTQIGELFAIITLTRILGPFLWADFADRSGHTLAILRVGSLLTVLSFACLFMVEGFWSLTLVFSLVMMFWTAILPQLEVITLQQVSMTRVSYGHIRLWGSVGFIVCSIMVGIAIDRFGSEVPALASQIALLALLIATLGVHHRRERVSTNTGKQRLWPYARQPQVLLFLLACALLQVSFGPYYGFFALYMRDINVSGQTIGLLIGFGVLAEVGIFLVARRLIARFGVWWLLQRCFVLTALRWLALADVAEQLWVVWVTQSIHALSFGLAHVTALEFIHRTVPPACHSRAQALYISVAFGVGGAIGNYSAGLLWQEGAQAALTFRLAAVAAICGALVMLRVKKN